MRAFRCDRCKNYYSEPEMPKMVVVRTLTRSLNKEEIATEICPDCQRALDNWWSNEDQKEISTSNDD